MEKAAFLELIQEHRGILYKISASYCRNAGDREDLMQEMIYQLWRSAERFDTNFKFSTWMYRIALNVAISFYRKTSAGGLRVALDADVEVADGGAAAGSGSFAVDPLEERIELLQRFIASLGEMDKALMILYLEERPYREIGEILGLSESNVATKLSRIKGRLKQQFLTAGGR
ncbi:MAG TPA: sigma-70 family RNA polymerase sigma factor [Puia sp.]|nr:sigma-70 family RNA polymerase sigma factor [Puia sp.]